MNVTAVAVPAVSKNWKRVGWALLLAVVAQAGHDDADGARRAYLAGMLRVLPNEHIAYAPPADGVPPAVIMAWVSSTLMESGSALAPPVLTRATSSCGTAMVVGWNSGLGM